MAGKKYEKYINKNCYRIPKDDNLQIYSTRQLPDFGSGNFSIDCKQVGKPHVMIEHPHKHTFDQYLSFFGTDMKDLKDFGAEIELCLGEEQEKHIINTPTVVFVEAGLIHGPIEWRKVERPVIFIDIAMTNNYARK